MTPSEWRDEVANGYENQILQGESYAEFDYQPVACDRTYRRVVVRKDIKVLRGQQHLFDEQKYVFYIANELKEDVPAREVIRSARQLRLRLLAYRPSVDCLLTLSDHISMPLRY